MHGSKNCWKHVGSRKTKNQDQSRFYWFSVAQPLVLQPYSPPTYPPEKGVLYTLSRENPAISNDPRYSLGPGYIVNNPSFRRFLCCFLYQTLTSRLQERRFGEAWGFSTRALLVHSSGRGRRIKVWERALCYLVRAEAQEGVQKQQQNKAEKKTHMLLGWLPSPKFSIAPGWKTFLEVEFVDF